MVFLFSVLLKKVRERERERVIEVSTCVLQWRLERDTDVDAMEDSNRRSNIYIGVAYPPVADDVQVRPRNKKGHEMTVTSLGIEVE
ncbi:hypothetical protein Csa_010488 [Cucumis sativus]|uniref:Uncharacterized protein n=1 Tax=Cucumis sativus TaxID=3659 RepID=A0A0A0L784_CUCSA|nr:hypothetical protein Csa_010488 [Cucumis sativus]